MSRSSDVSGWAEQHKRRRLLAARGLTDEEPTVDEQHESALEPENKEVDRGASPHVRQHR